MSKYFIAVVFGLVALIIVGVLIFAPRQPAANLDNFARCLSEKGAVMYGTPNCPFCQSERNAFGDSFRFVRYVDCSDEPQECLNAGVHGVPTWIFADGRKFEGKQGIEKLSQESGCPLAR